MDTLLFRECQLSGSFLARVRIAQSEPTDSKSTIPSRHNCERSDQLCCRLNQKSLVRTNRARMIGWALVRLNPSNSSKDWFLAAHCRVAPGARRRTDRLSRCKFDDQVDSTSHALDYLGGKGYSLSVWARLGGAGQCSNHAKFAGRNTLGHFLFCRFLGCRPPLPLRGCNFGSRLCAEPAAGGALHTICSDSGAQQQSLRFLQSFNLSVNGCDNT